MEKKISSEMIQKYLEGKCSPEEEKLILDWYHSFEDETDPLELMPQREQGRLKSRMMAEVRGRIEMKASPKGRIVKILLYSVSSVAALLLIALSFIKNTPFVQVKTVSREVTDLTRVVNPTSVIKRHIFPDGSEAWMQPATTISYRNSFEGKIREVSIQGEAFFDVVKNPEKPFVIHAPGIDVKVLGTSFNVKARSRIEKSEVSVLTGKVLVSRNGVKQQELSQVLLLPTEKAVYLNFDKALLKDKVEDGALSIWNKNSLSFDNIPVESVVKTLNKVFRSNIKVADAEITDLTLKADFSGLNLPAILELMGKSLDLTYSLDEETIVLKKI